MTCSFDISDLTLDDEEEESSPEDELDRRGRESFAQAQLPASVQSTCVGGIVALEGPSHSDVMYHRAMVAITNLAEANAKAGESTEEFKKAITLLSDKQKRKHEDELEEEEAVMIDEMVHIRDDSVSTIDMQIRQRLKNPSSCPSEWWTPSVMEKKCRPVMGQNLYLAHLMPGRVNPLTIRKLHDRSVLVTVKSLSSLNSGVCGEKKMVYKLQQTGDEEETMLMGGRSYVDVKTVYDVMDSVFNWMAVCHQLRPYSYEAVSLMRCLHHVRFFFGVTEDAKLQKQLLERLIGEVLAYNQRRGAEKKHPATFKKCLDFAKVSWWPDVSFEYDIVYRIGKRGVFTLFLYVCVSYFVQVLEVY